MMKQLYLKDGTILANKFNRVVHGERGDYVEFELNDLAINLISKFGNNINEDSDYYYYWLYPYNHPEVKIYYQLKTVKYADYKIGKLYINPCLLKNFKDPEDLFTYDETHIKTI